MGTTMEKQMDNEAINRIITKWKDQLETQYLYISQATSGYGRAYICSPCTAGTAKGVQRKVKPGELPNCQCTCRYVIPGFGA